MSCKHHELIVILGITTDTFNTRRMIDQKGLPLFYAPDIRKTGILPPEETGHATRVLRLTAGQHIRVTDGLGTFFAAEITNIDRKACSVEILQEQKEPPHWHGPLAIAIAPTKQMERMEWLVEKLVEIGIDKILLIRTEHSERKQIRLDRLERIAISAMKQSLKATRPSLEAEIPFAELIKRPSLGTKMIANCLPESETTPEGERRRPMNRFYQGGAATILIGPEGDFSPNEVSAAYAANFFPLSLGLSRLRTETAALVALQWLHTLQEI